MSVTPLDERDPVDDRVTALGARLGHQFRDPGLLGLALTHRSFCAEHPGHVSNERLEFLGDAVLGMVVTDHIFARYPSMPEGELAKLRAAVVSAVTLAEVARELDVGEAVRLGKGEAASGGSRKSSILADALEAILGALYLDGGMAAARPIILGLLGGRIAAAAEGPGGHDYKTQLQELAARAFEELPSYQLRDEGPDHEKRFFATVYLGGESQGSGEGRSKKQAEQAAARDAWQHLSARLAAHPVDAVDEGPGAGAEVDGPDPSGASETEDDIGRTAALAAGGSENRDA